MLRTAAFLAVLTPLPALAQSLVGPGGPCLAVSLGAGISAAPGHFGSDETAPAFDLTFAPSNVRLGPLSFGKPDPNAVRDGVGSRGCSYTPGRSSTEYEELAGFDDINPAIVIGSGLSSAQLWHEVYAVARHDVTGREALGGEVGMDLIARSAARLEPRASPRIFFGRDDCTAARSGVTAAETAL